MSVDGRALCKTAISSGDILERVTSRSRSAVRPLSASKLVNRQQPLRLRLWSALRPLSPSAVITSASVRKYCRTSESQTFARPNLPAPFDSLTPEGLCNELCSTQFED